MQKPYKYAKLRGRIVEKYTNLGNFADALGVSRQTVSGKLNCLTSFSQEDIEKWAKLLQVEVNEFGVFFFT